ncbi:FAD-binding oxidoreductase [Streptomyces sp. NPDC048603]|uniref:FAD-binding oxidoreductase n=1 Tax=Streptomyces sp. NPDC048603 TaxID=3365577 RepID=UPI0037128F3C
MSEFASLVPRVQGVVLLPGQEGFEEERAGFQRALVHRPDVIVGAASARDVAAAVEFATVRGLPVAVQATGHGLSVAMDGGVLVSTRRMDGLRVDAPARTVRLEAGVRWEQVTAEAARHGLAPLSGSAPHVGAVSYVLGGGLPLLGRTHGYAADHVRALEVVTADARIRQVTPDSDPDLFWALLGGRDNFGIVTALDMALVPQSRLYGGGLYFDAPHAADVLDAWRRWTATVPDTMNSSLALMPVPDAPALPEPLRGRYVAHVRIAHTGGAEEGEALIAPLRAVAPRLLDTVAEMPYTASGSIHHDRKEPVAFASDDAMLSGLTASDVRTVLDTAGPGAPVPCIVELRHLGGALAYRKGSPNAVGHRDAQYMLFVLSPLVGPFTPEKVRPVHRALFDGLAPRTLGRFLNFMGSGENAGPEQVRSAYDADDHARLVRLKAVHDPSNTFRVNYNLEPGTP